MRLINFLILFIIIPISIVVGQPKKEVVLNEAQKQILKDLPSNLVIAHRGTTFWAPEETEAAMRWARNIGADFLEFDLQRTKDGYLIALHDENLVRTTNISQKYPDRKSLSVSNFTYEEILALDAGSWFNTINPERARKSFIGLDILTLEDIISIAEGNRIKRTNEGKRITFKTDEGKIITIYEKDPFDNGNRPGIYVETKHPSLFPNIEKNLKVELERLGWCITDINKLKYIQTSNKKVGIANTPYRIILQTFSKESLVNLSKVFPCSIPICFLLWRGEEIDDIPNDSLETFKQWIEFAILNGATIVGPSIGGQPNNYFDLLQPFHYHLLKTFGIHIHAYSFDTNEQMYKYGEMVNGIFTNRVEKTLEIYIKNGKRMNYGFKISPENTLNSLGYY